MTKLNEGLNEQQLYSRHDEEKQELYRQIAEKDKVIQNVKKSHGKLEVFFKRVIDAIDPLTPLPAYYTEQVVKTKGKTPVVMVKHGTDIHMGAVQDPDEIEGFGQFNPEICERRCLGFSAAFNAYTNTLRHAYPIDECAFILTGDNISGDIHEELKVTNAFPSPEQVWRAAVLISKQIAIIAPNFQAVRVHFISADNHSRLTNKPQAKEEGKNSMNYLVGRIAQELVSKHSNVEFNLYPQMSKVVEVNNRRYLIKHGHDIRGWMGIPWYGMERGSMRESSKRHSKVMDAVSQNQAAEDVLKLQKDIGFNKIVHGHFHTPFDHPLFMCGGSVSGTDAYDHKSGRYSRPVQTAWPVHAENGELGMIKFQLDKFD